MIYQDMMAFLFKKKGAQITGTKIVRVDALSGTNNKNLEKPKGAVSVNRVDVRPGTKKMQFSRTKRTF